MGQGLEFIFLKAAKAERQGDIGQARAIYSSIIEKFPHNTKARRKLSELPAGALATDSPISPAPWPELEKLKILLDTGQIDALLRQAARLSAQHSDSFVLYNIIGVAQLRLMRFDQAAENFGRALTIKPDYADAHSNLGNALQALGRSDEAVAAYMRALAIEPNHADAHNNLANMLQAQGKLDEAAAAYRRTLSIKPDHAEAYNNLGNTLMAQGKADEAIAAYARSRAIRPEHAEAHYNLGAALIEQGRLDEAAAALGDALAVRPDYAEAHANLGLTLHRLGRSEEALAAYGRALRIKPDSADIHGNLGDLLREHGWLDQAAAAYRHALKLEPSNATHFNTLGVTLHLQGKLDEAAAAFARALAISPDFAQAHFNLGNTLQEQGKPNEAVAAYDRTLEIDPGYDEALVRKLHQLSRMCDWGSAGSLASAARTVANSPRPIPPFSICSRSSTMRLNRRKAQRFGRSDILGGNRSPFPTSQGSIPERIRVGYFSSDFYSHATMFLLAGLFREHDKSRFEVFVFSYGAAQSDNIRDALVKDEMTTSST